MNSMYELLMNLPLFKGVSRNKLSEIVGSTRFHFLKYLPGETVVNSGDPCTHIVFVLSGSMRVTIANSDGRFRVSQTLCAPNVLAPEFLFGRATRYPCTAVASELLSILQISKADYTKILNFDEIFLFNFLNELSRNAQKAVDGILAITTGSLEERIAFWIISLTQPGGQEIALTCKQRDLYSLFGVQRTSFLATLESLKGRGIIDYDANEIRINSRQELIDILHTSAE